jgi:hypothetical protein
MSCEYSAKWRLSGGWERNDHQTTTMSTVNTEEICFLSAGDLVSGLTLGIVR